MCGGVAAMASLDARPGSPRREGWLEGPCPSAWDRCGSCQNHALAALLLNK